MKISNSQIASRQKCEKRFYFEHILKLRPLEYPEAMEKGIFGHDMMKAFFDKMLEGGTYEECVEAVSKLLTEDVIFSSQVSVYRHVLAFGAYVFAQPWRVISVEQSKLAPVRRESGDDLSFAFTPDLVLEWTKGPKEGSRFIIDFKFTGQYWNDREVNMYQQVPKYIVYTNELEGNNLIKYGAVVMLNTRASAAASGTGLFMVKWIPLNRTKLQTIKAENEALMEEIAIDKTFKKPEDYKRTVDAYQCKLCFFADDLCPADLEGRPTQRIIERSYKVNTYFDDNYEESK